MNYYSQARRTLCVVVGVMIALSEVLASGGLPTLITWPGAQGVPIGAPLVLSASASGDGPFSYQWRFRGVDIPGATGPRLAFSRFSTSNAGPYSVVVRNAAGAVTSPAASIVALPVAAFGANAGGQTNVPLAASNAVAVASGQDHIVALKEDGTVVCWGTNKNGQCTVPVGLRNAVAVAAGLSHTLALREDGTVVAWGLNSSGQATVPASATNVIALAAGAAHSLALRANGTIVAWGANQSGQTNVPASASNIVAISAAGTQNLAWRADNTLIRWGSVKAERHETKPVLGIATGPSYAAVAYSDGSIAHFDRSVKTNSVVDTGVGSVAFAVGTYHDVSLQSNGRLVEYSGTSGSNMRVPIPSWLGSVVAISASQDFMVALIHEGPAAAPLQTRSLTAELGGSLVLGFNSPGAMPRRVAWATPRGPIQRDAWDPLIVTGVELQDAGIYVPSFGALGGVVTGQAIEVAAFPPPIPQILVQPQGATVSAGTNLNLVVIVPPGSVVGYQWARDEIEIPGATGPVLVLTNIQSWNAGDYRVVLSNRTGQVVSDVARLKVAACAPAFSSQPVDQLTVLGQTVTLDARATGSDPIEYQWRFGAAPIPGAIEPTLRVMNVRAEDLGRYSVMASNKVGVAISREATLSRVSVGGFGVGFDQNGIPSGATNIIQIAQGSTHTLGLRSDGTVIGWGTDGSGGLSIPASATNVVSIAAGVWHSLALRADGTVLAWGSNIHGEGMVPDGLSNVVAIACGTFHNLAARADGTVLAWGDNFFGACNVPPGLRNVVQLTGDAFGSGALTEDGRVVVWGSATGTVPPDLTDAIQLGDSVALRRDGTLVSWNGAGPPAGLGGLAGLWSYGSFGIAVREDGTVESWGISGAASAPSGVLSASVSSSGRALVTAGAPEPALFAASPATNAVFAGSDTAWRVVGTGRLPVTYRWFKDGQRVAETPHPFLALTNVQAADAGAYSVSVVNSFGIASAVLGALKVVEAAPSFASGLVGQVLRQHDRLELNAPASGSGGITYQWWRNDDRLVDDARVAGSGSSRLVIEDIDMSDAGTYRIEAVNSRGRASMEVQLVVLAGSLEAAVNSKDLSWTTGGAKPWAWDMTVSHDGLGSLGSDSVFSKQDSYVETTAEGPIVFGFWWKVSCASTSAFLRVMTDGVEMGRITGEVDWQYQTVFVGSGSHRLRFEYVNTLTYASGANRAWLDQFTESSMSPPVITAQPVSRTVNSGTEVLLGIGVSGTWPFAYQWSRDGVALPGETAVTLRLENPSPDVSGLYRVSVTNVAGAMASSNAAVVVNAVPPAFSQQPAGMSAAFHTSPILVSRATGAEPLQYQWLRDGVAIPGETRPVLGFADVQEANEGVYQVVVSNPLGSVISAEAKLRVVSVAAWGHRDEASLEVVSAYHIPSDLKQVRRIAAGYGFGLAIRSDGVLRWWGAKVGMLEGLPSQERFSEVAAGFESVVGLSEDGLATEWMLSSPPRSALATQAGLLSAVAVAGSSLGIGLQLDGSVVSWSVYDSALTKVPEGLGPCVAVAGGSSTLVALRVDGSVVSWGTGGGPAYKVPSWTTNIVAIASGGRHGLGLVDDGRVVAWGANDVGQTNVPADLADVVALAAGEVFSAALRADGTVVTWGAPAVGLAGEPGSLRNVVALAGGSYHGLAIVGDGRPVFTVQPHDRTLEAGGTARVCAMAVGEGTLVHRWFRNGVEVPGANGSLLIVNARDVSPGADGDAYRCEVSNALGQATSATVRVMVQGPAPELAFDLGGTGFSSQGFVLRLAGLPTNGDSAPVVIEVSPDLLSWRVVSTNTPVNGVVEVVDGEAVTGNPGGARFYRASRFVSP